MGKPNVLSIGFGTYFWICAQLSRLRSFPKRLAFLLWLDWTFESIQQCALSYNFTSLKYDQIQVST